MRPGPAPEICVQGTSVALDGIGLLLRGPSGSGKSDLALRLIDGGAVLVADDLTRLVRRGGHLFASLPDEAPAETRGRLELRGLGLVPVPSVASAPLGLVVDLKPQAEIERLPESQRWQCLGVILPVVAIDPMTASAAAKLRLVAGAGAGFIMPPP